MTGAPDVTCEYDDGYFDKDEQGWCARWTRISQDGAAVTLRQWGDDNGVRGYDETRRGTIAEVLAELGLVKFGGGLAGYYFDLRTRRLRSGGEQRVVKFVPAADSLEPAGLRRAIDVVAAAVQVLGGRAAPRPEPPPWPPLAKSPTCWNADEVKLEVDAGEGRVFRLMRREFPDGSLGPQLAVDLVDGAAQAWLFISRPEDGQVVLMGPLERHGLAQALVTAKLGAAAV